LALARRPWPTLVGAVLALDGSGGTAPGGRLFQEFKFTAEHAAEMVRQLLARRHTPGAREGSA
jgi:transketolase